MPFVKGQSGNPGGRARMPAEMVEAFREHTDTALKTLVGLMACEEPGVRVKACNSILDRGWGTAPQTIEIAGKDGGPAIIFNITGMDGGKSPGT